jgi:hypothetical protein
MVDEVHISKHEGSAAEKTRRQVDNAVRWLQKHYFIEEVETKKRLNKSATRLIKKQKNNKNDKNSSGDSIIDI